MTTLYPALPNPAPEALSFSTADGGTLPLAKPYRGTLVVAGPDSGKTTAIAAPMVAQFVQKNFAGLVYGADAALAAEVRHAAAVPRQLPGLREHLVQLRSLDFAQPAQSARVNPWHPSYIPSTAVAMQFAATLLGGIGHIGTKRGGDFFSETALKYLTAIILYYRNNHPALCTVPHVVATVAHPNFIHVLSMLGEDADARAMVQGMLACVEQGSDKQLAGIISFLQVQLKPLRQPAIAWLLAPDEPASLDLNDPTNPALLTITPPASMAPGFASAIGSVVNTALSQMNHPHKHPSFVVLDDAETIYIEGLETIPATCRANKLAFNYLTSDVACLLESYGRDRGQVLLSCLYNQFYGQISSPQTGAAATLAAGPALPPDGAFALQPYEFIGQLAGMDEPAHFRATLVPSAAPQQTATASTYTHISEEMMASHTVTVRLAVERTVAAHRNKLRP